jgi:hypothetical protein
VRKCAIFIVLILTILALVPTVGAQDDVCQEVTFIEYGDSVTGRITDELYFDAYCFEGSDGDEIVIDVEGTSGDLDTLVRLWDNTIETLFEENDDVEDGNTDSQIVFTLPADGDYLILVSRYELEDGSSTGGFELTLTAESSTKGLGGGSKDDKNSGKDDNNIADPSEVITLDCDTGEILYGGLQFGFISINPGFSYTVTVFGIDDFDPVLAVETEFRVGSCNDDERDAAGSFAVVPGEGNLFANTNTAQVRFSMPRAGSPVVTVGSFDGQGGQFAMVIEGLAIQPNTELDGFVIRVPEPLADETLSVYMISRYADLDPFLQIAAGEGLEDSFTSQGEFIPDSIDYENAFFIASCDDAGSSNCEEDTPALPGGGIDIANGRTYITGHFDAGIQLVPETTDPLLYVFGSSERRSRGEYAILIIGTAPTVNIN